MTGGRLPLVRDLGGEELFHVARDGTRVRFAQFMPNNPRAYILFLPGFTEFIEKHLETIGELLTRGYGVLCLDWRGQGLSDRELDDRHRGYVASMNLFVADMAEILALTGFFARGMPCILLGHSMGGHLALRVAMEIPGRIDRIVLCAPMIDILTGSLPRGLAPIIARLSVWTGWAQRYLPGSERSDNRIYEFEGNLLTHDPDRFYRTQAQIARNPDLAISAATFGWVDAAFRSIKQVNHPERLASIAAPVLLFQAGQERIVSNPAQDWLCSTLPNAWKIEIPESRHEILSEIDAIRAIFWREVDRFLGG